MPSTRFPLVTLHGIECVLILPPIAWNRKPRIIHSLALASAEGRTGIEARASEHHEVRLSFDYGYTLEEAAAVEFLDLMDTLDPEEQRILLPIWPELLPAADFAAERLYTAAHWLNLNVATGAYSLDADGGHPESVGLAMCSFLELPQRKPRTDIETDVILRAEEDSPWEARIGINPLAQAAWNFDADWASAPDDTSRWQQRRQRLGHSRLTARTGTGAPTKRGQAAGFTFTSHREMRRALTFWAAKRGPLLPFTVPRYFRPGWDGTPEGVPVMQAHFYDETLTLEFCQPTEARTRLTFDQDFILVEGQPQQARPSRAYLYKIWWEGSASLKTWTDWPQAYTHAGLVYVPQRLECTAATETMSVGQNDWKLLVADFDGNPLRAFGRLALERRLLIEIREFDPAVADAAALVFKGEIKSAPNKGPLYTATAAAFGGALQFLIPGQFAQTGCNNTFCDALCALDIEDFKVVGSVAADSATPIIDVTCGSAAAADYFALGYVMIGADDDLEIRYVLRSEPVAGGQRLTLNRPLWHGGAGDVVALYPGCDQQFDGGCTRYDNRDRFFGAPHKAYYVETVSSGFKTKTGK